MVELFLDTIAYYAIYVNTYEYGIFSNCIFVYALLLRIAYESVFGIEWKDVGTYEFAFRNYIEHRYGL